MHYFIHITCLFFIISSAIKAEEKEENNISFYESTNKAINSRLDQIEKTINNKGLFHMLTSLESLQLEISKLRGEVELQTHNITQLKKEQRDRYIDIDSRLQKLESEQITIPIVVKTPELEKIETSPNLEVAEEKKIEPIVKADPIKAETEYERAFKLLKKGKYKQALVAFKAFLKDYPDSSFCDNVQYWLGETNYVIQNYELAINEYQALLNTYPDSQKIPNALLKIGYSYAELGNTVEAKKTLNAVKNQYPDTSAAHLADQRLRKINRENNADI